MPKTYKFNIKRYSQQVSAIKNAMNNKMDLDELILLSDGESLDDTGSEENERSSSANRLRRNRDVDAKKKDFVLIQE